MQPVYFLGLNGPPRVGKDLFTQALLDPGLSEHLFVQPVKYAERLKTATHALFGGEYSEEQKNLPSPYGPTWRQLYIGMSEDYAKKITGDPTIFGRILVTHMRETMMKSESRPTLFVASDCGFEHEQLPVIEWLGEQNCKFIQVHREGCDFRGDSRSYISPRGCQTLVYLNDQPSAELARQDFLGHVTQLFTDWGWVQ